MDVLPSHKSSLDLTSALVDLHLKSWVPSSEISEDENWMDLLLLLTRLSQLQQGSMACILVRSEEQRNTTLAEDTLIDSFNSRIIGIGLNRSLYRDDSSDVHAEIVALGQVARRGSAASKNHSTEGCTAYITMPPCRNCFGALYAAGIQRIVSRYECKNDRMVEAARRHGIEFSVVSDSPKQRDRVQGYAELRLSGESRNDS